jgi:hypothetical protein
VSDERQILDLFDRLVAVCVGVVPSDILEEAAETGRAARRRIGYLGDTVVVALAGGTGSGKSSLVNALAGEEVTPTGVQRPTTSEPVAWIPQDPEPGLTRLLDDMSIHNRVGQDRYPWLALIDLPDTDSVVLDHRQEVLRVLPLVDAVVWVMDPEKYQDARMHRDHIAPAASSSDRFVFLLNQVDRLPQGAIVEVVEDLRESLENDGVLDPSIVVTAGDPPDGLPIGLADLVDAIKDLGSTRSVVTRHVIDELSEAAERLLVPLGGPGGTSFGSGWTEARDLVAEGIAEAVDTGLRAEAEIVASRDAGVVTSWLGGRRVADTITADPARVSDAVSDPVMTLVGSVASEVERESRQMLVRLMDGIEAEVTATAAVVGATTTVALDAAPMWWRAVRLMSYSLAVTLALGLALAVDAVRSSDAMAPGLVLSAASVGLLTGLRFGVRRSTRARVMRALGDRQLETATQASAELERRVGRPLRDILRARSAPGAAHTELMLAVQRYEETQT